MASKKLTDLVVTAAMVAARRADSTIVYLYRGTPLPPGLAEGEAARLADLGMVGETAVPVVAEPPRPTARVNGRSRPPAAAPAATATKKAPAKSAAEKAAEKAAAEKAAAEAAAEKAAAEAAAQADSGAGGDGGADGSKE